MSTWTDRARWRASGAAALLVVSGALLGVLVDRLWLVPAQVQASPLTAEELASRLGLSSDEKTYLRVLLDSLHAEIRTVVQQSPESLGTVVDDARRRIEATLPADARPGFHAWMREHHQDLTNRLHGGSPNHGRMHGRDSGIRGH